MDKNQRYIFFLMIAVSPFVLYALTKIQPTFDDWTYLTYPNDDPEFWKFILPYGYYWRPFDAIFGYVLAIDLDLFPALNHIIIYLGHLFSALMIYLISRQLHFCRYSATTATVFYFISPAMLGAVLDIDSINQIYSAAFGLLAMFCYLSQYRKRTALWILFCTLAVLSKENGIMWLFVIPLIAYTFEKKDISTFKRHIGIAIACTTAYFTIRLLLPHYSLSEQNEYLNFNLKTKLENLAKFIILTCCSTDFISLFHKPNFNLPFLIITTLLSFPLFYISFVKNIKIFAQQQALILIIAAFLVATPHLLTLFSTMHAYAALGIVALLLGYIINQNKHQRRLFSIAFLLYTVSAIMVDSRHYVATYRSGMIGYNMAQEVLAQTKKNTQRAFCISIDRNEQKYSTFCVIPYDAFGWGNAVYFHTRHRWPKVLKDKIISKEHAKCCLNDMIKQKFKEGYDHIWIVDGTQVKVIEK